MSTKTTLIQTRGVMIVDFLMCIINGFSTLCWKKS